MLGTFRLMAFGVLAKCDRAKTVPEGYVGGNARFSHVRFSCTSYNRFESLFGWVE
jgi:hypothetical protein